MRVRCICGKIASSLRPCRSCTSVYPMLHCHNRAHKNHGIRPIDGRWGPEARGYNGEGLGPCTDMHAHPFDNYEHLNEPGHEVGK